MAVEIDGAIAQELSEMVLNYLAAKVARKVLKVGSFSCKSRAKILTLPDTRGGKVFNLHFLSALLWEGCAERPTALWEGA